MMRRSREENSSMDWKNTIILLTGASSGIGEALAIALAKKGGTLGLLARREPELRNLASRCQASGGTARVFAADVTDAIAIQQAAGTLRNEFGRIDILIANAGIGGNNSDTRELQPEAVKKVIDINHDVTPNTICTFVKYTRVKLRRGISEGLDDCAE